jgi:hypothetical protein
LQPSGDPILLVGREGRQLGEDVFERLSHAARILSAKLPYKPLQPEEADERQSVGVGRFAPHRRIPSNGIHRLARAPRGQCPEGSARVFFPAVVVAGLEQARPGPRPRGRLRKRPPFVAPLGANVGRGKDKLLDLHR